MQVLWTIVLPVFGIILAGYLIGRLRLLGEGSSQALNGFAYWVALPALLLVSMTRVPVAQVLNLPFIVAFVGGTALTFALAAAVGAWAFPTSRAERMMQGLAAVFANAGYMGVPLFLTAFGRERALPAIIAMVLSAAITMGSGVALVEVSLSLSTDWRRVLTDVARALFGNPLVIAPLLGLLLSAAEIALPAPIETFFNLLGAAAAPCALFALGLFLVGKKLHANLLEIGWITLVKLAVQPLITWTIAVPLLGMEPFWAASAVLLSALPTAALVFTLAQQYGIYVERASSAILVTTLLSVVTVPLILLLLGM
jgi:malonate transporter